MTKLATKDHWAHHARQWSYVRSPLRPGPEDAAIVRRAVDEFFARERAGTAPTFAVLGVTPELCEVAALSGARVVALDLSTDMIGAIWPGSAHARESGRDGQAGRDHAVCADWRALPLADGAVDVALLDGGLSALAFPDGYDAVCGQVRRALGARGRWVVRCFASPDRRERLEDVLADLARGAVANFHVLKWRLAMAIEPDARTGVAVGDVYDALASAWGDFDALARHARWPVEEVRTIEAYRGVATRYTFPSLAEYEEVFARNGFRVADVAFATYALGERCPTFVLDAVEGSGRP